MPPRLLPCLRAPARGSRPCGGRRPWQACKLSGAPLCCCWSLGRTALHYDPAWAGPLAGALAALPVVVILCLGRDLHQPAPGRGGEGWGFVTGSFATIFLPLPFEFERDKQTPGAAEVPVTRT